MSIAVVGWTGLIGQTLVLHLPHADLYNSSNVKELIGKSYDIVYFCGMPAEKWRINQNPKQDYENTHELMRILKTIYTDRFILISTVDVLDCSVCQDETGVQYATHPYGHHRRLMEEFVSENFPVYNIVRLPGLFGKGLKKNIIYDLIYDNQINNICLDSEFQWYNVENILKDIETCVKEDIQCAHLVSPSISVKRIIESFFPEKISSALGKVDVVYNLTTNTRSSGYWVDSSTIMSEMGSFIKQEICMKHLPVKLAVSNIVSSDSGIKDMIKILTHNRIKAIEIAPTKFAQWVNWSDDLIEELKSLKISFVSCQSILFNANIRNIFLDKENFIKHYEYVSSLCYKLGITNIVFGSPNARHLFDASENDAVLLFRHIGQIGKKYNIVCCLEPNAKEYGCSWLTTLHDAVEFIKKVSHSHVRVTYDIGNYLMEKDSFEWDSKTIQYLGHVQVSNEYLKPMHLLDSEKIAKYSMQLRNIIGLGYSKCVSMEMIKSSESDLIKSVNLFTNLF